MEATRLIELYVVSDVMLRKEPIDDIRRLCKRSSRLRRIAERIIGEMTYRNVHRGILIARGTCYSQVYGMLSEAFLGGHRAASPAFRPSMAT
jgi:hypothetical protein